MRGSVLINIQASRFILGSDVAPIERSRMVGCDAVVTLPGDIDETNRAVIENHDLHLALADSSMVVATQRDQVRRFGLTTLRPVLDVMRVDPSSVIAARE